eukprot:6518687-Prymnesium_polylepis.1
MLGRVLHRALAHGEQSESRKVRASCHVAAAGWTAVNGHVAYGQGTTEFTSTFGEASALIASAQGIISKLKKANSSNHVPP